MHLIKEREVHNTDMWSLSAGLVAQHRPPSLGRGYRVRRHIGERGERGKSQEVKAITCGEGEKIAAACRAPGQLGLMSV